MKTTMTSLLALALATGAALAHDDCERGQREQRRGPPPEERDADGPMARKAMRGGEGRPGPGGEWRRGDRPDGPISPQIREEIRAEHRAIRDLGMAARNETDPAKKAELVGQLRAKLGEIADRIQAHQEERLAQAEERFDALRERIEHAKANRDALIEEQVQNILEGKRPSGPAGIERFPHAKGGRFPPPPED